MASQVWSPKSSKEHILNEATVTSKWSRTKTWPGNHRYLLATGGGIVRCLCPQHWHPVTPPSWTWSYPLIWHPWKKETQKQWKTDEAHSPHLFFFSGWSRLLHKEADHFLKLRWEKAYSITSSCIKARPVYAKAINLCLHPTIWQTGYWARI